MDQGQEKNVFATKSAWIPALTASLTSALIDGLNLQMSLDEKTAIIGGATALVAMIVRRFTTAPAKFKPTQKRTE